MNEKFNKLIPGTTEPVTRAIETEYFKADYSEDEINVNYKDLKLNRENSKTPEINIRVRKEALVLEEGEVYGAFACLIDNSPELEDLASKANELSFLPEGDRLKPLMDLFNNHFKFAYEDEVERIRVDNPELADWIDNNSGLKSPLNNLPLSELLNHGYGVCRHLAIAFLWLANKAGLKGSVMFSNKGVLKNIKRTDNGKKLFRSVEVGEPTDPHSWVEVQTVGGRWIPIDPSSQLIGDTEDGLKMFREANYLSEPPFRISCRFNQLVPVFAKPSFAPGEDFAYSTFYLSLPPKSEEGDQLDDYTGNAGGKIDFYNTKYTGLALKIVDVRGVS